MLWVKSLHIIFMVTWFAGLFYLPRLFVYHASANAQNQEQISTFKVMERKLMALTHIGGALTLLFGLALLIIWLPGLLSAGWMHLKLLLILGLFVYHGWCMQLVRVFREDRNTRTHVWYRLFNEVPVVFLFAIVMLAILKPF